MRLWLRVYEFTALSVLLSPPAVDLNSQSRALREPNEPERLSAATGLIARPLFERNYCLPVLLNVYLAPGDHLRSYVKCFSGADP